MRQTLAATAPTTRTINVSAAWNDVQKVSLRSITTAIAKTSIVPPATIDAITGQLSRRLQPHSGHPYPG